MGSWPRLRVLTSAGLALALAIGAAPCAASGGRATYQFRVSVKPVTSCTVSAIPLIFMIPIPTNSNVDSTSQITVKCPPNTPFTVAMDYGIHANGINRRVFNSSRNAYLKYDVYKDVLRSSFWGTGGNKELSSNSGLLGTVLIPVYGRVVSASSIAAGGYTDQITITVSF